MTEFLYYLLKVSICLAGFLGSYLLFLKKLSFFKANRIYLLATLGLSFVIPSLSFERSPDTVAARFFNGYDPTEQITSKTLAPITINHELNSLSIAEVFGYLYLLITLICLLNGFLKIYQLIRSTRVDFIRKKGLKVIYKQSGFVNCSFFNYVFIDQTSLTNEEMEMLLKHEQVHARQFHTLDKLILVACKAILWFNPVIYLYEKALEEVHEFEADAITANAFSADVYASLLLEMATKKQVHPVLHSFSKHPLKGRIFMLFSSASKAGLKWSYLMIIPLLVCLCWLFAFKVPDISMEMDANNSKKTAINKPDFVLLLDAGHGGEDHGAEAAGLLEKDLTLQLLKKVAEVAKENNLNVSTTRDMDQYMSLKDRVNPKADLLISLHVNQDKDTKMNGIQLLRGNAGSDQAKGEKFREISYQLYKHLSKLKGIETNSNPKEVKGLYLLDKSKPVALILELGYLTNEKDRGYLTDPTKQQDLAKAIVNSILAYQHNLNKNL